MELVDIVTTPERRAAYRDAGFWNEDRLPSRVEMFAAHNPEKIAIVDFDGRRAKTYRELAADTNRVASLMLSEGISTGDVVTVQLPNWFETVVIDLAVIKVGAVLNPVLPLYRPHELATIFETGRPTFVFSPAKYRSFDYKQMIAGLRACTPSLRNHIAVPDPETDWLASYAAAPLEVHVSASAVSELIFTSGTEARPKAIMHTEETTNFAARAGGSALGLRDDDVVWMPSPIGHSTGLNYACASRCTTALLLYYRTLGARAWQRR